MSTDLDLPGLDRNEAAWRLAVETRAQLSAHLAQCRDSSERLHRAVERIEAGMAKVTFSLIIGLLGVTGTLIWVLFRKGGLL